MPNEQIIWLDDYRPTISGTAKCMDCHYEWLSVAPVGVCILECPKCETMRGTWKYDISREEDYMTCECGNKLFYINPDGIFCPKCGNQLNA